MTSIYTYSNIVDFDGKLTQSNKEYFRARINSDAGITPNCSEVRISVDVVEVVFDAVLSLPEDTVLQSIVASKYSDPYIFDAIVDANGTGDFLKIADAFAAGKTSVYVRDGVYIETSNIVLPDGGQLVGESQSNVKIVLAAGNSVIVDGSAGVKLNTGTISIANQTKIVTGAGTTFTSILLPYSYILIGTNFYEVVSVQSDTSLTLKDTYEGKTIVDSPCLVQKMHTGVKITNLVIVNSSATGVYLRAIRHCGFRGIAVLYCTPNLVVEDSGDSSLYEIINGFSNGVGLTLTNTHSMLCDTLDVYNATSHGILLAGASSSNVFDSCSSANNGGIGLSISSESFDINVSESVFKHNNNKGLFIDVGSNNIIVSGCTIIENAAQGADVNGVLSVVSNNVVKSNSGNGIDVGGSGECIVSNNQICENGGHGLFVAADSCTIVANRFANNTACGAHLTSSNSVVSANIASSNGTDGILYSGANTTITGNNARGNGSSGIHLGSAASNSIVAQNIAASNTQNGLLFDSGAASCIVSFNMLAGNTGGNIVDNGTGNELTGNKLI